MLLDELLEQQNKKAREYPGLLSRRNRHVRFTPESGHLQCNSPCPLWAKSGLP